MTEELISVALHIAPWLVLLYAMKKYGYFG